MIQSHFKDVVWPGINYPVKIFHVPLSPAGTPAQQSKLRSRLSHFTTAPACPQALAHLCFHAQNPHRTRCGHARGIREDDRSCSSLVERNRSTHLPPQRVNDSHFWNKPLTNGVTRGRFYASPLFLTPSPCVGYG